MKRFLYFLISCLTTVVVAEEMVGNTAMTVNEWQSVVKIMPIGNAERGKALYSEKGCASCHGEAGISDNPAWPVLAGQRRLYVYKLLLDYRAKRMNSQDAALMSFQAEQLTESDMADLAQWLSSLKRPKSASWTGASPNVLKGDHGRLLPPCASCHGANGQGWETQPALMGQNREFLIRKLQCLKDGVCHNDINAGMRQFASKLSDAEIQEIANFYGR